LLRCLLPTILSISRTSWSEMITCVRLIFIVAKFH
jgi:hypothetical protein